MTTKNCKYFCLPLLAVCAICTCLTAGCKESKTEVSKTESDAIHKPLGQPMPPEAQAAMAKAMANKGGAGAPAPK